MQTPSPARRVPYLTSDEPGLTLEHRTVLQRAEAEEATKLLFKPAPKLRRKPFEVTLLRSRWIYGARIDDEGRTDVIGAYLLAAGVPEQELRECAQFWPWTPWARQVDVLSAQCVQANHVARLWSTRASLAESEQREAAARHAALLEHQLIALFAQQGVCLSIIGELTPAVH